MLRLAKIFISLAELGLGLIFHKVGGSNLQKKKGGGSNLFLLLPNVA